MLTVICVLNMTLRPTFKEEKDLTFLNSTNELIKRLEGVLLAESKSIYKLQNELASFSINSKTESFITNKFG